MRERKETRKKGFDYSASALYFITSITKQRFRHFGLIKNRMMVLNQFGEIAERQWYWLEQQFPYIILHAFVVMPDHIHGIIEIDRDAVRDDPIPQLKSLSQLIGAYKTTVSKQIHLAGNLEFAWQRSFHDHIIRNHTEYERISNYIIRNPARWTP